MTEAYINKLIEVAGPAITTLGARETITLINRDWICGDKIQSAKVLRDVLPSFLLTRQIFRSHGVQLEFNTYSEWRVFRRSVYNSRTLRYQCRDNTITAEGARMYPAEDVPWPAHKIGIEMLYEYLCKYCEL